MKELFTELSDILWELEEHSRDRAYCEDLKSKAISLAKGVGIINPRIKETRDGHYMMTDDKGWEVRTF